MSATDATARFSQTASIHARRWLSRLSADLRAGTSATEQAHNQRRLHDHLPDAALHDAGKYRDDATGIGNHQTALPFFLQSGFGKR